MAATVTSRNCSTSAALRSATRPSANGVSNSIPLAYSGGRHEQQLFAGRSSCGGPQKRALASKPAVSNSAPSSLRNCATGNPDGVPGGIWTRCGYCRQIQTGSKEHRISKDWGTVIHARMQQILNSPTVSGAYERRWRPTLVMARSGRARLRAGHPFPLAPRHRRRKDLPGPTPG